MTMQGKIVLVTGATAGMGKATATALAQQGATVVLTARNRTKGEATAAEIRAQSGNNNIDVLYADLASQQEIHRLADTFKQRYRQLHVLVNNAGGLFFERQTTVDNLEMTFAVDHLAYFLLTNLLLDTLISSAPARIINIASNAEAAGRINFDDLQSERGIYIAFQAYAQAKLANVLFTYELARRLAGTGVTVNAVRPGPVATNFGSGGRGFLRIVPSIFRLIGRSSEEGAQTAVDLATLPQYAQISGKAFYNRKEVQTSPRSHDVATQQRLWQVSEALTNLPVVVTQ